MLLEIEGNSMKLFIALIIIVFAVCITYLIVKTIKQHQAEKEKKLKEELKEQEWQRTQEKRRNIYYNNLPYIYDNLSTQTLRKACQLLDNMVYYNPPKNDRTFVPLDKEQINNWSEEREKLLMLINPNGKYLWKDISNSMNAPLWEELDLKHVKSLLDRR